MLYVHCGWPRTGTSSLQAALSENMDLLAASGVVYPKGWTGSAGPAHSELYSLLDASLRSEGALETFKRFLDTYDDRDVLLSAEGLSNWLLEDERREAFATLLTTASEAMPTTSIWTLRRLDDAVSSLYLLALRVMDQMPSPAEAIARRNHPANPFDIHRLDDLFAGMKTLEDAVDRGAVYLKYDSHGTHNAELLSTVGVPDRIADTIRDALDSGPRRNASLSHKQAVALLNVAELSVRAGVELDRASLRRAFRRGELSFERDRPCEPIDKGMRRALHEQALAAARRQGFTAYIEFFDGVEVGGSPTVDLGPDVLNDEDLKQLATLRKALA